MSDEATPATAKIPVSEVPPEDNRLVCTIPEAARRLCCQHGLIRKLVRQRKLKRLDGVRKVLIPVASLEAYVRNAAK